MSQTAYTIVAADAFPGLLDMNFQDPDILSRFNEESARVSFGLMVRQGTAAEQLQNFSAAGQDAIGVTVHRHTEKAKTTGTAEEIAASGGKADVLRKGRIWVATEEAVAIGDDVFFRHTASGGNTVIGRFRTDADGVAEVDTLTPAAVNDTDYVVRVVIAGTAYSFHVTGDGSATATEIADDFRTQMAADATFTALVVATGTTTLILTSQNAGELLDVTNPSPGVMAIVETTPPAPTADNLTTQARWLTAAGAAGFALLEVNLQG